MKDSIDLPAFSLRLVLGHTEAKQSVIWAMVLNPVLHVDVESVHQHEAQPQAE